MQQSATGVRWQTPDPTQTQTWASITRTCCIEIYDWVQSLYLNDWL